MAHIKVLVIDDDVVCAKILSKIVQSLQYEVAMVDNAEAGLSLIEEDRSISLVLCDWMLPGMSGVSLCQHIRKHITDRFIYVILVTGKTSSEDLVEGLRSGADAFLKKPISKDELVSLMNVGIRILTLQNSMNTLIERQNKLLTSIPSFFLSINSEDVITTWNKAAEEVFGILAEDAIEKPFLKVPIQWDWYEILLHLEMARDERKLIKKEDILFRSPEGEDRYVDLAICPMEKNSQSRELLLIGEDVTRRKNLNEQLSQAQKLESIGQLAAGIAHEMNSPLQYIGDNVRFLESSFAKYQKIIDEVTKNLGNEPPSIDAVEVKNIAQEIRVDFLNEDIGPTLSQTLEGIARLSHIIKAMKDISHPGSKDKVLSNICDIIETAITLTKSTWKYAAIVQNKFAADVPNIYCFPHELSQVFINMIVNATHAIEDSQQLDKNRQGTIDIITSVNGDMLVVEIADNGAGIPLKAQPKIFDQFFTTKEVGKGTGQGLAISYASIVKLHKGKITFKSEESKGTSFFIHLPLDVDNVGSS